MKKGLRVFALMLIMLLTACAQPHNYTIVSGNLESFFEVTATLENTSNGMNLVATIEPKHEYERISGSTNVEVLISYMYGYTNVTETRTITFNLNVDREKMQLLPSYMESPEIHYFQVKNTTGEIKTSNQVDVKTKSYDMPDFIPEHEDVFIIEDMALNTLLFNELNDTLLNFGTQADLEYFTQSLITKQEVVTGTSIVNTEQTSIFQLADNYIYFNLPKGQGVITEDHDKLIHYKINPSSYKVNGKLVLEYEVLETFEELTKIIPMTDNVYDVLFIPDVTKMKVKKLNYNTYTIIGYIKDLMPENDYSALESQLSQVGITPLVLSRVVFNFRFKFDSGKATITGGMTVSIPHEQTLSITSEIELILSINPFEKIDVHGNEYIIEPANSFDKILFETDVTEPVTQVIRAGNHKYYTYLERGQYELIDENDRRLSVNVYDEDFNVLSVTPLLPHLYGVEVFIPADGYYYLNVNYGISSNQGYTFYLKNRNFETTYLDIETLNIGINEITFEGELDFIRFEFHSNAVKMLKIYAPDKNIGIYPQEYFYSDGIHWLEIPMGKSYFTLVGWDANTYTLEVTEVDVSNYATNNVNEMSSITTNNSLLVTTSSRLGYRYLKLEVTQAGVYTIEYTQASTYMTLASTHLLNTSLEVITQINHGGIALDVGTYIIRLSSDILRMGYVKYSFTANSD